MPEMPKTLQPSESCYELIKHFEGFYPKAYQDPVGVWTIGYGTILYPNGLKVKQGDVCTPVQAETYLKWEVDQKSTVVRGLTSKNIVTQNQFDALVSFAYNLGIGALQGSTLLRKLRVNPSDPTIYSLRTIKGVPVEKSCEFLKWVYASGRIYKGLVRRRASEAYLYGFGKIQYFN